MGADSRTPTPGCTGSSPSSRPRASSAASAGRARCRGPASRWSTAWAGCCRPRARWCCRTTGRADRPALASPGADFFALTPDRVLDAVEVGGLRCTGRCLPLRAFENRVYEVELDDDRRLVVKFYRPGRWSRETILDEHAFLG